jgi:hypothetical protein
VQGKRKDVERLESSSVGIPNFDGEGVGDWHLILIPALLVDSD